MPVGEWYCENPNCVVRECTIYCKLDGDALPKMNCPACSSNLKFHHWIGFETLMLVDNEKVDESGVKQGPNQGSH